MKKLLEKIHHEQWDIDVQKSLVNEILQVDTPPDFNLDDLDRGIMIGNPVRWIQFALALFYQKEGVQEFVEMIAKDLLDDLEYLGESTFYRVLGMTDGLMRFGGEKFWEDTDRGNVNIFFTPHKDQIDAFKQRLLNMTREILIQEAKNKFLLTDYEAEFLWDLSRKTKENELAQVTGNVTVFEKIILEMEELNSEQLDALVKIREKLRFNSENPSLILTTSRQIAPGTEVEISGKAGEDKQRLQLMGIIRFNSLNYMYISLQGQETNLPPIDTMPQLTLKISPPRQRTIYQCRLPLEGTSADGMYRLGHSNTVKIIAEN